MNRSLWLPRRRRSVVHLVRRLSRRHPEFECPITWDGLEAICAREHITIRVHTLPAGEKGWLLRLGNYVTIRLARALPPHERLWTALHELAHFFSEDIGEMCMYADDDADTEQEEFCEIFAWYCCDIGAREFLDRREGGF